MSIKSNWNVEEKNVIFKIMVKKLFFLSCFMLVSGAVTFTQNQATSYCPGTLTAHHKAGSVAPVTADIVYDVIPTTYSGMQKCWITRNLGATTMAAYATDATVASAGWNWQFNRKQGYSANGVMRVPVTAWITAITESSDWVVTNDPCALLLGSAWRLPTNAEWTAVITAGSFATGYAATYNSQIKLHAGGSMDTSGALFGRGAFGYYWSSTQNSVTNGYYLLILNDTAIMSDIDKTAGFSVRCLRDY